MISCLKSGSWKQLRKARWGYAGAGTDNTHATGFAFGLRYPELSCKAARLINSIDPKKKKKENARCRPIIPLFFHIIPYLHKKQPVNYLTRGVKKTFQIVAVEENVWVSVNHYHMTTHVLKVERSSMSVIQHRWRTPLLSLFPSQIWGSSKTRGMLEAREAPWNDD